MSTIKAAHPRHNVVRDARARLSLARANTSTSGLEATGRRLNEGEIVTARRKRVTLRWFSFEDAGSHLYRDTARA